MLVYIAAIAVLVALASSSDAGPVPDAPPRCAELVITNEWLLDHKLAIVKISVTMDPNELAVPAVIRAFQELAPECDWTPSTTTEIKRPDGSVLRFDAVLRELQGLTVAEAMGKMKGVPIPGKDAAANPAENLVELFVGVGVPIVVDPTPPKPPVPPVPPVPPMPPLEGSSQPGQSQGATVTACTRSFTDGDANVCLMNLGAGKWSWEWTSPAGASIKGEAGSATLARILAYRQAALQQQVAYVVPELVARAGVRLSPDGTLGVFDSVAWVLATSKRLRVQWTQGERDPMGIVLSALQLVFPAVNWFRIKPPGGMPGARDRVKIAGVQFVAAPDIADRLAYAIIGTQPNPLDHVWRGQRVRIREQVDNVNGNEVHRWQYKIDDRPWIGSYTTQGEATTAAHGA